MRIKFPKWRKQNEEDLLTPDELRELAEEEIEVEMLPGYPHEIHPVGLVSGSGVPITDSRISGPGTYKSDRGGVAEFAREFEVGDDSLQAGLEFERDKYPTDYSKIVGIPKYTTRAISHKDPWEVSEDLSHRKGKGSVAGINKPPGEGWPDVMGFGSPKANEIHWPLKGIDGELDHLDVLAHEISHKALGHFDKKATSVGQSIESYNISKLPFVVKQHPELISGGTTNEYREIFVQSGQILDEFEVRLYQEAEEYPIDKACRFDRFVKTTKQNTPRDWPSGIIDSIAIQALINMTQEGVIHEKTARLYIQRIRGVTPKEVRRHSPLGLSDELDLGDRIYDPDDLWMGQSSASEEEYFQALEQDKRKWRRVGTKKGKWTR